MKERMTQFRSRVAVLWAFLLTTSAEIMFKEICKIDNDPVAYCTYTDKGVYGGATYPDQLALVYLIMTAVSGIVGFVLNDILHMNIAAVRQITRRINQQILRFVFAFLLRLAATLRNRLPFHTNIEPHHTDRVRRYPGRNRRPPNRLMYN